MRSLTISIEGWHRCRQALILICKDLWLCSASKQVRDSLSGISASVLLACGGLCLTSVRFLALDWQELDLASRPAGYRAKTHYCKDLWNDSSWEKAENGSL